MFPEWGDVDSVSSDLDDDDLTISWKFAREIVALLEHKFGTEVCVA